MIRTLITLAIGAAAGIAYAHLCHQNQELREELIDRELALDDAESMIHALARREMKARDEWPRELQLKEEPYE